MFDGSSIRGFQAIHESDMKLIPDPKTAYLDPFRAEKTLVMNFSIRDPFTDEPYSRDPRNIAAKAEEYLKSTGIADTVYFGAEAEFYVFDDVRFETKQNTASYFVDSVEGAWNSARQEDGGNLGYKTRYKGGYFPVPPVDHFADLRDEMTLALQDAGLEVERAHHEVGTGGQAEINYKFSTLTHSADQIMLFKYIIKNVAWKNGRTATFMPKPLFGDNGSGMHCHQSFGRTARHSSTTRWVTAACPTPHVTTSVACSHTHRVCSRSPTRPSTATGAWCLGSKHRSTSCTRSATVRHASASRSPEATRRPSASSSASPTRPRTRTSRSQR